MTTDADTSNVVLITVDSLRADAISPYDSDRHTPVFDGIADRGAVFEHAFATGNWTPFSFPSILASRPVFADTGRIGVDGVPTLAGTLSDAGIATGGFNAANGFLTSHWGYDDGFDEFEPFVADISSAYSRYLAAHPTVEAWLQLAASPFRRAGAWLRRDTDERPFLDTSRMFDVERSAAEFVEDRGDEPFFLWVHYMDAHTPYVPAPRYVREVSDSVLGTHRMILAHTHTGLGWEVGERTLADLRTLYQGAVRQVDASVGRLLATLEAAGLRDETCLIVAGDHGEEFQDHGHLAHYPKLYDELIRVPLIVDAPGVDGRRVEGAVGLDAIPPTVTGALDVAPADAWAGESLLPSVRGEAVPADRPVVSVTVRGEEVTAQPIPRDLDDGDLLVSARTPTWTYVENVDAGGCELYHRPTDPDQQADRSVDPTADDRAAIERLRPVVREHARRLRRAADREGGEGIAPGPEEPDEAIETRLSALGYR